MKTLWRAPEVEEKRYQIQKKWRPKGAKVSQGTSQNTLLGTMVEKVRKKGTKLDYLFDQKSIKIQSNKPSKQRLRKNMILISKGYRNGAELDATTNQNPMPKQVTNKIVKVIKNLVDLICKTMKLIIKAIVLEGCAGCVHKPKSVRIPPNNIPKPISKTIEINAKTMIGIIIQKYKITKNKTAPKHGAGIHQNRL